MGRRRRSRRRALCAAAARRRRGRRGRRRRFGQVRRPPRRDASSTTRSARICPPARPASSRSSRRTAARGRAGAPRLAEKSVVQSTRRGCGALKDGLAEAMGKFVPDRTVLPIPDRPLRRRARPYDRRFRRRLVDHPRPKAPEGAPNVLVVLIDDAGLRRPRDLRRRRSARPPDARARDGTHIQPLPRDGGVLADTRRDAHGPQPPSRRHGLDRRVSRTVPGLHRRGPRSCTPLPRILQENGYVTGGFGKWHLTPGQRAWARPGRSTTGRTGWGFDHWWGFLTGAAGQYDPIITQDNSPSACPRARTASSTTSPTTSPTRPSSGCTPCARRTRRSRGSCTTRPAAPRAAPRGEGVGRQVQGPVRRRLGRLPREDARAPEEARHRPARTPSCPSGRTSSPPGTRSGRREEALRAADGGLRRLLRERRLERRPAARRHRGDRRPRQHAGHLHLGRQRRQHGGHDHRLVQRDDVLQRHRARRRRADEAHREVRRHRGVGRLPHRAALRGRLGARQNTPFQWGKQMASHLGGTRNPMVVAWPNRIKPGDLRPQFTHCIDIVPTVLELVGHPRADPRRRHRAGADGRHELRVHAR